MINRTHNRLLNFNKWEGIFQVIDYRFTMEYKDSIDVNWKSYLKCTKIFRSSEIAA